MLILGRIFRANLRGSVELILLNLRLIVKVEVYS